MSQVVKLKRSTLAGSIPASLALGEPAYNIPDNRLFVGNTAGVVRLDAGSYYAECNTSAGLAAKTVDCPGFVLIKGVEITIKFMVSNTASTSTLTLNVNGTGGKPIRYRNYAIPSPASLAASRIYKFVYDGSDWEFLGDFDTNTTYGLATTAASGLMSAADKQALNGHNESAKRYFCDSGATSNDKDIMEVGASGGYAQISLVPGRRIAVYFRWGGNMGTGTLRFGINNGLFLPVYYNGEPAKQGVLKDKHLYEFMYNPASGDTVSVDCWMLLGDHEPPVTYSVGTQMVSDAGAAAALVPVHNRRMDLVLYYYDGDHKYATYVGPDLTNSSWTYNNYWNYNYL